MSFVGRLASSGKRVYVRRLKGDATSDPIAFAVFADVGRNGKMVLVARFHDPFTMDVAHQMFCANGTDHGVSACHWTRVSEPFTAEQAARWSAHWWSHVGNTPSEVVALVPTVTSSP